VAITITVVPEAGVGALWVVLKNFLGRRRPPSSRVRRESPHDAEMIRVSFKSLITQLIRFLINSRASSAMVRLRWSVVHGILICIFFGGAIDMEVILHCDDDLYELQRRVAREPRAMQRDRCRAVLLAAI
jgi:hypothetical protein